MLQVRHIIVKYDYGIRPQNTVQNMMAYLLKELELVWYIVLNHKYI